MKRAALFAVLLSAATLVAPTHASAVGETCRGEAATIVGSGNEVVHGTDGRDVVVTNNSFGVFSGGGDDLVCVTGRARAHDTVVTMETGDGNDVVDATLAPRGWSVALDLGTGADEFVGGAGSDTALSGPQGETDVDVMRGGAGSDELFSNGGADELYGDNSPDRLDVPAATAGVLDGGAGRDEISFDLGSGNWRVDLATGAERDDVRTHTWTSIETLTATKVEDYLNVVGTTGRDTVTVQPARGARPLLDIRTGRGADSFLLSKGLEDTSGINLGAGTDDVRLDRDGDITLYLRTGTLVMGGVADVSGVENAKAYGRRTVLIGTNGRNRLKAGQCDTLIRGLGGADDLALGRSNAIGISCGRITRASEIHGGAGRDLCSAAMRRTNCERTD